MKVLAAILFSIGLTGCVIEPAGYVAIPTTGVVYEPNVIVGGYAIGYYRDGFGYWTGDGWDVNFYANGHAGWGHHYRGAPRGAWGAYRGGPHYNGGHVGGGGHYHR
ncbi:MAG: hypothetical protein ACHP65_03150 [Legionellales bacterium]